MNSFAELITTRRSTRKFTSELLSPEEVEMIMAAALKAPSSKRKNPWQFILVDNKDMLKKLAASKEHGAAFLEECALAIVVTADGTVSDVWIEDASIAAIYMQLQAEDLGLGSCWVQIRNRVTPDELDADEYVRSLLDIPYQLQVLCIIGIGHKAQERKPFDDAHLQWEKVHIDKFTMPEK
ncbi:nitroreductase family protein [Parabacteroides pacaensis]|uniref:nitroreductase family protein n=1 Tax=Parabacteroides pacaensis TaxID=2086575 RepID=UPI000D0F2919|nr:nitroreductase family protein [Parabacteroides pacaensis]